MSGKCEGSAEDMGWGLGEDPGPTQVITETLAVTLRKMGSHGTVLSKELLLNEWLTKHHDRRHRGPRGVWENI